MRWEAFSLDPTAKEHSWLTTDDDLIAANDSPASILNTWWREMRTVVGDIAFPGDVDDYTEKQLADPVVLAALLRYNIVDFGLAADLGLRQRFQWDMRVLAARLGSLFGETGMRPRCPACDSRSLTIQGQTGLLCTKCHWKRWAPEMYTLEQIRLAMQIRLSTAPTLTRMRMWVNDKTITSVTNLLWEDGCDRFKYRDFAHQWKKFQREQTKKLGGRKSRTRKEHK